MPRLSELKTDALDEAQRSVLEAIESGPRGSMGLVGPFGIWVRSPTIGQMVQSLGSAVRFETSLAEDVKEVAICTVGTHYHAKFEFAAHQRLARHAGVSEAVIEALQLGIDPQFDTPALTASYRIARGLLNDHRLDDETYSAGIDVFGESGLIELVSVIGYYCLVSLTLNAFEVPITENMTDPFPDFR